MIGNKRIVMYCTKYIVFWWNGETLLA